MSNLNMKSSLLVVMVLCVISSVYSNDSRRGGKPSATQGPDLFVNGRYLNFAVNPSGGFGSRTPLSGRAYGGTTPPSTLHKSPNNKTRIGITVDYDFNGWAVGSPPQSGDFFLEGYSDVGWHLTWEGASGLEEFDQSPMQNDDDDADTSFSPYRGCIKCVNGKRADGCDETAEDCSCNLDTTAYNFIDCPFKRWDLDTVSINRTQDSNNVTIITYVGVANARYFDSETSGHLYDLGERIRVTKVMVHYYNQTYVTEHTTLENIGNVTLNNVALVFHIVPTPEAFPYPGVFPKNSTTDFANWISLPNQNTAGQTLIKARGQNYNITTALGTNDADAKAWYGLAKDWRAKGGYKNLANKMWTMDPKSATTTETLSESVITLGFKVSSLAAGAAVTKAHFWAFTGSAIAAAQANLQAPFTSGVTTGITTGLSTGITTGITSKDLSTGVTTALTSQDLSTGVTSGLSTGVTSQGLSTGVTSHDVTTGVTSGLSTGVTSNSVSTGVTTQSLSTGVTSQSLSTGVTSHDVTTGVTSQDVTTGVTTALTTGLSTGVEVSTGVTPGGEVTTGEEVVTTGEEVVTTGEEEVTTANAGSESTTGVPEGSGSTTEGTTTDGSQGSASTTEAVAGQATTGTLGGSGSTTEDSQPITTHSAASSNSSATSSGAGQITTGSGIILTNSTESSSKIISSTGEDAKIKDRNVKIIASVFGVAGFILLVLCVGGIILAVRRMQKDPVV